MPRFGHRIQRHPRHAQRGTAVSPQLNATLSSARTRGAVPRSGRPRTWLRRQQCSRRRGSAAPPAQLGPRKIPLSDRATAPRIDASPNAAPGAVAAVGSVRRRGDKRSWPPNPASSSRMRGRLPGRKQRSSGRRSAGACAPAAVRFAVPSPPCPASSALRAARAPAAGRRQCEALGAASALALNAAAARAHGAACGFSRATSTVISPHARRGFRGRTAGA